MKLQQRIDVTLLARSMGKTFEVVHVAKNVDEANQFTSVNPHCSVIAEDKESGLVYIAKNQPEPT